jgi:hypothetical protein
MFRRSIQEMYYIMSVARVYVCLNKSVNVLKLASLIIQSQGLIKMYNFRFKSS